MIIVNYKYIYNGVRFLLEDGKIIERTFKDLGYPYFYAIPDEHRTFTSKEMDNIAGVKKRELNILTPEGIIKRDGYKIYMKNNIIDKNMLEKFKTVCQANIPYIRQLALDGKIQWTSNQYKYGDIDIEELKGEIKLIGYKDNVDNEYIPLYSLKDLTDLLEKRKILSLYAWNGDSYDFSKIGTEIHSPYYDMLLKLDAMKVYSTYAQKSFRTLNQAGIDTNSGEKISFSKPFTKLTKQELEEYNQQDVELQRNILNNSGIRDLIPIYSNYTFLSPKEISAMRVVDNLMIHKFGESALLLDKKSNRKKEKYIGGHVIEPIPNLYYNVASLDTNSLYPHVVMYENYDSPKNFIFNIAKEFEKDIYNLRLKYKKLYNETKNPTYDTTQRMFKILMNGSFYGVFGNVFYRYEDRDIASFITERARSVLAKLVSIAESFNFKVIYGDTDSIFIQGLTYEQAEYYMKKINEQIYPYEVKLEKYFTKMILL